MGSNFEFLKSRLCNVGTLQREYYFYNPQKSKDEKCDELEVSSEF